MRLALVLIVTLGCGKPSGDTAEGPFTSESSSEQSPKPGSKFQAHPLVKAHRGASEQAPENTLRAVQLAFEQGADAAEIDVRVSKDGVVVVFHDEDTKRIGARDQLVSEQTLRQLQELDVGAWKGQAYIGQRIATLEEMLVALPQGKTLFVEIKDGVDSVSAVVAAIKGTPTKGQVAIESFDRKVLEAVSQRMPALALHLTVGIQKDASGVVIPFSPALAQDAKSAGFSGLSVDARSMSREFALAVRAQELELAVWTVNQRALLLLLRDLPITWIETDVPAMVMRELSRTVPITRPSLKDSIQ